MRSLSSLTASNFSTYKTEKMNYQQKLENLRNEIVAEFHKITDRPEEWLPHTVFIEDEGEDNQGRGVPVYTQYKLIDYLPDGECLLLNVVTNEVETGSLCGIEIDWLVTLLNWYGELTGKHIQVNEPDESQELRAFAFPIELDSEITDDELLTLWRSGEEDIQCYQPNAFATLINNEMFDEQSYYIRFITVNIKNTK